MALFGKKGKKANKKAAKEAKSKKVGMSYEPAKETVSPDIYTLFLGLAALSLITAALVLGLNYYWYQAIADPAVLPMNTWAR